MKESFFNRVRRIVHSGRNAKILEYDLRREMLYRDTMHCTEPGVTTEKLCGEEVVVSLTTYGRRLRDVSTAIESIMQGSIKPNHIVLWLGDDLKDTTLPITLQKQQARGLEIRNRTDIGPAMKLIPSLSLYPEATIIIIDDDLIYQYDLVETLVTEHIAHPENIIANRVHRITMGANGRPKGYTKWDQGTTQQDVSPLNFQTGVGGVLYPPHCLADEVLDEQTFMELCGHADDVWFYCMALKKGTLVRKAPTHNSEGEDYLCNEAVQDTGLLHFNTSKRGRCANDVQFEAVMNKYDLWEQLSEK